MLSQHFRPWGLFSWIFPKIQDREWDIVACISTEERCIGAPYHFKRSVNIRSNHFLQIVDPEPIYKNKAEGKTNKNYADLDAFFDQPLNLSTFELLGSPVLLKKHILELIDNSSGSVIIDISSFPKRYFFPIIKILIQSEEITNLIATYTVPEEYFNGNLAEEPTPWAHLPMFQRIASTPFDPKATNAIIGVGFLPFGLAELLKGDYDNAHVNLIFPFPPGPPNYQRNWEFIRNIETRYPLKNGSQIIRVDALDAPGCYRHLSTLTDGGNDPSIFAPYGPKPHSLAMCLFAIKHDCDVYYTQPRVYHPDYCTGIKQINSLPETYAYCLKLNGRNLY